MMLSNLSSLQHQVRSVTKLGMQVETMVRFHLTPKRMAIIRNELITNTGETLRDKETLYIVNGNVS